MLSIIITAYKEEKSIGKAIEAVLSNEIKDKFELLVLAPDEPTLNIARSFSKKFKQVQAIKDAGQGKPSALNLAFKIAKGEILILTDGDVFMSKNAIQELLSKMKNPKIGAVSSKPVSLNSRNNMLGYWGYLLSSIADLRRKRAVSSKKRFYCSGYLYALKNGIVKEIPKETLSDDGLISHIVFEKGYSIDYAPEAEVYVKYPTNFKDWLNQKRRSAGGYNQIKSWTKKEIRSFSKESFGALDFFKYVSNIQEAYWLLLLFFARLYLWFAIFKDINLEKKDFKKIWVRIDSTK